MPAEAEPSVAITPLPVDPAYPKLRTVPPRPQLSYSVEQHRKIVESLIGDREHARYTSQRVRYRTGLSSLPPPPRPEPDATATARAVIGDEPEALAPPAPRADIPTAASGDIGDPAVDDGDLGDFIRSMVRETEPTPSATTEPSPDDDAAPPEPDDSSSIKTTPEMSAAPASHSSGAPPSGDPSARRLFAWLDGIGRDAGPADAAAGEPPSAAPASSKAHEASPPAGAVPVAAAAVPRQNGTDGAKGDAPPAVEVAVVSEPAAMVPGAQKQNARASRDDTHAPSPAPPPAAPAVARPKLKPDSHIQRGSETTGEPGTAGGSGAVGPSLVTLTFADGSAELPSDATPRLEDALTTLKKGGTIEIVGQAKVLTLALDRARAVALGLMRLGAGAGDLKIAAEAAPANRVRILVGGRPAGN